MKIDQSVKVTRLPSGLYKIEAEHLNCALVGGAASTAMALNRLIFVTEAMESSSEIEHAT